MKSTLFIFVSALFGFNSHAASLLPEYPPQPPTMDTIYIGATRDITSLYAYFNSEETKENVYLLVDEGTYYSTNLWIDAENLVIEGRGQVNLYCTELYENVMWISGNRIVVKNLHMKHFAPGRLEGQNCSGRVIGFDNAHNVTIENCDLNGCGLAGLHDNFGNSNILIKNNYIHNNSVAAYTNIEGGEWFEEVDDHPVFRFENNRIENNGPDRILESDRIEDFIIYCPEAYLEELKLLLEYEREAWQNVTNPFVARFEGTQFGDYVHIVFKDAEEKTYDLGFGYNDFSAFELYTDEEEMNDNPNALGKQFKIHWEWKASSFPCCSGEYEMVEAFLPSITHLELIETDK